MIFIVYSLQKQKKKVNAINFLFYTSTKKTEKKKKKTEKKINKNF